MNECRVTKISEVVHHQQVIGLNVQGAMYLGVVFAVGQPRKGRNKRLVRFLWIAHPDPHHTVLLRERVAFHAGSLRNTACSVRIVDTLAGAIET
ncbi:hypothetical protein D3C75_867860 [compost metagenome]